MQIKGDYNYLYIDVDESISGHSLKEILRNKMYLSSRLVTKRKQTKDILLNGNPVKTSQIAYEGDNIILRMDEKSNINPEKGALDIVYEDIDVLVINKEAGMIVHPTKNHQTGTLLNKLIYYASEKGEIYKPHLVNRLDRDTSGLLIVAKNPYAHYELMKQMEENTIKKHYLALCKGEIINSFGLLDYKILDRPVEEERTSIKRAVSEEGKIAETIYKVKEDKGEIALVELELITGRTHQIRVHMTEMGHPLFGDSLYGEYGLDKIDRQALHAYKIKFYSPRTGKVELETEMPEDMKRLYISF